MQHLFVYANEMSRGLRPPTAVLNFIKNQRIYVFGNLKFSEDSNISHTNYNIRFRMMVQVQKVEL